MSFPKSSLPYQVSLSQKNTNSTGKFNLTQTVGAISERCVHLPYQRGPFDEDDKHKTELSFLYILIWFCTTIVKSTLELRKGIQRKLLPTVTETSADRRATSVKTDNSITETEQVIHVPSNLVNIYVFFFHLHSG